MNMKMKMNMKMNMSMQNEVSLLIINLMMGNHLYQDSNHSEMMNLVLKHIHQYLNHLIHQYRVYLEYFHFFQ
ncbi:hypothetical protein B9K06_26455, partial [Bacillus sp. OG2]